MMCVIEFKSIKPIKAETVITLKVGHYLRDPQEMAPAVATQIKEKPLLIGSNYFGNPQASNFILWGQFNLSVNIQIRC